MNYVILSLFVDRQEIFVAALHRIRWMADVAPSKQFSETHRHAAAQPSLMDPLHGTRDWAARTISAPTTADSTRVSRAQLS